MRRICFLLLVIPLGCGEPVHEFRYAKAFDEAKTVVVVFMPRDKPEKRVTPSQDWIDRFETQLRKDNHWRGEKYRKRELTNIDHSWHGTVVRIELRGSDDLNILFGATKGGALQFLKPGEEEWQAGYEVKDTGPYHALFKELEKGDGP